MEIFNKIKKRFAKMKKGAEELNNLRVFAVNIKPKEDFERAKLPDAPDYQNLKHWAAHPDKDDKTSFVPSGIIPTPLEDRIADVFFIHPTSYFGKTWNASLEHPIANEMVNELMMAGQASVFNSCCRIFAPRYRQATFYSFLYPNESSRRALELAYEDVATAFDFFIKNRDPERPFFIGSHSQGTCHAIRLLEEKIDQTPLVKKMVAAYTIGFQFPKEKFQTTFKNIRPCQSPTDTQCVIAYDTYVEGGKPLSKIERTENWFSTPDGKGEWRRRGLNTPLGINPLSWTTETTPMPADKNRGAVSSNLNTARSGIRWDSFASDEALGINAIGLTEIFQNECSAKLEEDGFLYISKPEHRVFRTMLLPSGNYHNYDYALFYMNLRKNVKERLGAYLK